MEIYRVGGSVRDSLLKIKSSDKDYIVFDADEKELTKEFPGIKKVGRRKSVFLFKGEEYTLSQFSDINQDLASRDLTINAVARSISGKIISHPKALTDLKEKILRPVSTENFFADPLRVFRAARFSSSFPHFTVSDELKTAMEKTAQKGLTADISAERVGSELKKAFSSPAPENFILLLKETGNLEPWFQEFKNAHKIPAGPVKYHGQDSVLDHTLNSMKNVYGSPLLVWMAFCHDIGKTDTEKGLLPKHYDHEKRGIRLAKKLGERLKLPNRFITGGMISSQFHMKAGIYNQLKPSTKVRLLLEIFNKGFFREVFIITKADKGSNFIDQADEDLKKILNVKLPKEKKGLGEKSGQILFQMRCEAIKNRN